MKTVVIGADRHLVLQEVPVPDPGEGEVRLDVAYSGICGSDLHIVFDSEAVPPNHVLGHEFSGRVAALGPSVVGWSVGDRVAVLPMVPCGSCAACKADDGVCLPGLMTGPGLGRQGGFSESVVVPAQMLVALPDTVGDKAGALVEPLAVAIRGVRRSGALPGIATLVLGAGPVGLMAAVALRARGVTDVVIAEPNPARRDVAAKLGLDFPIVVDGAEAPAALGHAQFGAVIDCTGHPAAAAGALGLLAAGGRLVVVGIPMQPSMIPLSLIATSEIVLTGSLAYSRADFAEAVEHLAAGKVPVDRLVTATVPLECADELLHELHDGATAHMKVMVSAIADRVG